MVEDYARTFADHWTGDGTIESSGDDERLLLYGGQVMTSEVWATGIRKIGVALNQYLSGDAATVEYRTGADATTCQAASWTPYTGSFDSLGYVQVRLSAE